MNWQKNLYKILYKIAQSMSKRITCTFKSFLAGLSRLWVYNSCYSVQRANKPVHQLSLAWAMKARKMLIFSAKLPCTLEPIGLSIKGDVRRPDCLTYTTWKNKKCLIWDFTCADVKKTSKEVGSAAEGREDKKVVKYSNLSDHYHFVPVGIETYA